MRSSRIQNIFRITLTIFATLVLVYVGARRSSAQYTPQSVPTNPTDVAPASLDPKYNPFGVNGCIWRKDVAADGTVTKYTAEQQAPSEFYLTGTAPRNPCDFYSSPNWKNLKDVGEAALWPVGCFNPLNYYWGYTWIGAYGSFEFNKNYDHWDAFYYAMNGAVNRRKTPPYIELSLSHSAPRKGENETIAAQEKNYTAPSEKLLYGWSSQKQGKNFISQQGLAAGGKEITQVKDIKGSDGNDLNTPECKVVTRTPASGDDTNHDGMSDAWEMQYFQTLNVDPIGDKDKDGVQIVSPVDPTLLDTENRPRLIPAGPSTTLRVPAPDPDAYLGIRVTPDTTAPNPTGNGTFSNMEEYIWGTNPLDADSDDDGYMDGADIVGLGQKSITFPVDLDPQDPNNNHETYRAAVVGTTNFIDETNSGHRKIMIASKDTLITASTGDNLQATITEKNDAPSLGEVSGSSQVSNDHVVQVQAGIAGSDSDRAVLEYTWYVEFRSFGNTVTSSRVKVPPTPDFTLQDIETPNGRLGKYLFKHPIAELAKYAPPGYTFTGDPGSLLYISVDIANPTRHEVASKRIPVALGTDSTLELNLTDLNTGNVQTAEEYALSYCRSLAATSVAGPAFCTNGRVSLNEVLPWLVFQGSKVVVTAGPLQVDKNALTYKWWLNDEPVAEKAGTESQDNLLTIYPEGGQKTYNIKVRGYTNDRSRTIVFSAQVEMQVVGPVPVIQYQPTVPALGDSVTVTGLLTNFPENMASAYNWKVTKADGSTIAATGKTFSFTPEAAGPYTVSLDLTFQGDNNSEHTLHATQLFIVGSPRTVAERVQRYLASARTAFAKNSALVYQISLLSFGVILIVLATFRVIRKKQK